MHLWDVSEITSGGVDTCDGAHISTKSNESASIIGQHSEKSYNAFNILMIKVIISKNTLLHNAYHALYVH